MRATKHKLFRTKFIKRKAILKGKGPEVFNFVLLNFEILPPLVENPIVTCEAKVYQINVNFAQDLWRIAKIFYKGEHQVRT